MLLTDSNIVANRIKSRITDSGNILEILNAGKFTVFIAMIYNAFGQTLPNTGKKYKVLSGSGVNVDLAIQNRCIFNVVSLTI